MNRIIELMKRGVSVNLLAMENGNVLVGCAIQQGEVNASVNQSVKAEVLTEQELEATLVKLARRMGVEI